MLKSYWESRVNPELANLVLEALGKKPEGGSTRRQSSEGFTNLRMSARQRRFRLDLVSVCGFVVVVQRLCRWEAELPDWMRSMEAGRGCASMCVGDRG